MLGLDGKASVLDHGFVQLVETWGSDERVIESARMSTGKGFNGWGPHHEDGCAYKEWLFKWGDVTLTLKGDVGPQPDCSCDPKPGDEKLLRFLWENQHATPFEMAGATFEIQAPIFVFREWHRHRTQSYSEMSARYAPLPDVNYIPSVERLMLGGGHLTKQAGTVKGAQELDVNGAETFRSLLADTYFQLESLYQSALKNGVPKELARIILPVGRYSRMRASANLRNWLGFLTLRNAPNAQYEIRAYAEVVQKMLAAKFPRTLALFEEKRAQ